MFNNTPMNQNNNAMEIFMMSVFGDDYYNTRYVNNNNNNNNNPNNNINNNYYKNFNSNYNNNYNNNYQNNNNFNNNIYYQNLYNGYAGNNNFWKHGYNTSITQNTPKIPAPEQMYNCVFKTTQGFTFNIPFNGKRTTQDLVLTFFRRVDREDLFKTNEIALLYNASKISFESEQQIIQLFKNNINPIIIVMDIKNLIGA